MAVPASELQCQCMHGAISHASRCPPDVILRRSFTSMLAVIEGLGTRLVSIEKVGGLGMSCVLQVLECHCCDRRLA